MKIAVITVTYNDEYKFNQWKSFYNQYSPCVDYHIIVDNGSSHRFLNQVKTFFSNSIIIERQKNGGCTGAYNTGIQYVLDNTEASFIMLLGNDIKIDCFSIIELKKFLSMNPAVGMVAPILLLENSTKIADFGDSINENLMLDPYMYGEDISNTQETIHWCDTVTGGANMSTRRFYKEVGLQDEALFMYSDEIDMGLRAKNAGFKIASISKAICWHQHVNLNGSNYRKPYSAFLMARNKIYLARKHSLDESMRKVKKFFLCRAIKYYVISIVKNKPEARETSKYILAGLDYGKRNDMSGNKYTQYD